MNNIEHSCISTFERSHILLLQSHNVARRCITLHNCLTDFVLYMLHTHVLCTFFNHHHLLTHNSSKQFFAVPDVNEFRDRMHDNCVHSCIGILRYSFQWASVHWNFLYVIADSMIYYSIHILQFLHF
jgi:hypothetical protein